MKGFAHNLVYIRQHYGVTQEALAEQLGVSRQTISKWEAGINFPETDKLLMLCDLYHTNLDDLMRGSIKVANIKDTELYNAHMNRFSRGIVAGIVIILCGVATYLLLDGLGITGRLCIAALLSFLVMGVVSLVVSALTHGEFKRKHPSLDPSYPDEVLDRFGRRFIVLLPSGIALILLGVILFVALSPEGSESTLAFGVLARESLALVVLMVILALGVGIIVYAAMQKSKYDLSEFVSVTTNTDSVGISASDATKNTLGSATRHANTSAPQSITTDNLKRGNIIGAFCGIIMLLSTVFFFVLSYNWIAFLVGIVFCGIVSILVNTFYKSDTELIAEIKKENPWARVQTGVEAGGTSNVGEHENQGD